MRRGEYRQLGTVSKREVEEGLDEQPSGALHAVRMADEPSLLMTGQASHPSFSCLRPFRRQCPAHFFGHIVRLIVGEVVLTPEFLGGGNDRKKGR
jgi:hypothetical protein